MANADMQGAAWDDWFEPGERLLWEGAPMKRLNWSWSDVGTTIFGIPFFAAGVVCSGIGVLAVVKSGWHPGPLLGGIAIFIFGLPFIGVGLAMSAGPWLLAALSHRRIRYALTNRRAYIASRWWKREMKVFPILPDMPLVADGGTRVIFYTRVSTDSDGDRTTTHAAFENIADAAHVYRLLRQVQGGTA